MKKCLLTGGLISALAACSSGSGGGGSSALTAYNVVPITLQRINSQAAINRAYVTVTICQPGTSNCQTIDNILVDSGSTGLRIFESVINPSLNLPQVIGVTTGLPVAECAQFGAGYTWGSVKTADVKIAGEVAPSISIDVFGVNQFAIPQDCKNTGTLADLPSNGIIGINPSVADFPLNASAVVSNGYYYLCSSQSSCAPALIPLDQQVSNPVAGFTTDNNGEIFNIPAIPESGAAIINGTITFGIGTQANNSIKPAIVLASNPGGPGYVNLFPGFPTYYAAYNTQNIESYLSIFDSGTPVIVFPDPNITTCGDSELDGYYCPISGSINLVAGLGSWNARSSWIVTQILPFTIYNAESVVNANYSIANPPVNLPGWGAYSSDQFIWGMPFFYGKSVYFAINGRYTPYGIGGYYGYSQ